MVGLPASVAALVLGAFGAASPLLSAALPHTVPQGPTATSPQGQDELDRLRSQLRRAGPDGREAREQAVERLLGQPTLAAHRLLGDELLSQRDPDGLRATILNALARHALQANDRLFGGATEVVRAQILHGYFVAVLPLWGTATDGELLPLAQKALQRLPARELDAAARSVLASAPPEQLCAALACLADLQQTLYAPTIAEALAGIQEQVRGAATEALQRLLYPPQPLRTVEQFQAFWQQHSELRYVDLAERAARRALAAPDNLENQLRAVRREADRAIVRALVERSPGIDWASVQMRTVVDDVATRDACLEILRDSLRNGLPAEDSAAPRLAFARALLARHKQLPSSDPRASALLLEVVASLVRADDPELPAEVVGLLLAQLDAKDEATQLAALRGLRRFPSVETRARLVQLGRTWATMDGRRPQLAAALATLATRTSPRWLAPLPTDADKADWLFLVAACLRMADAREIRESALQLTQVLDGKDQRVPEVFDLLVALARDAAVEAKVRAAVVIQLQGWRSDPVHAEPWVSAMQALLSDPAPELRRQAADSLAQLTSTTDGRRSDWIGATIGLLRNQLEVETDPAVLRDLVDTLQLFGREPQMPERAIGALLFVLREMNPPLSAEQQARIEPLLQALTTIAADPVAANQWIPACQPLQVHRKRQSLRLILQNHAAADFAKEVKTADPTASRRAKKAMQLLIETALLKPAREPWAGSDELLREARDVRTAFGALEAVEDSGLKDTPALRLLRLEVDLVSGKFQDVVQRAASLLNGGNGSNGGTPAPRVALLPEDEVRVRTLAAEAQLALARPEQARKLLEEAGGAVATDAATLDLVGRIGRALLPTDAVGALALFDRVLKATPTEDAGFRARFVDWLQAKLIAEPDSRAATLQRAQQHAALFEAADCPLDLRASFDQLRTTR